MMRPVASSSSHFVLLTMINWALEVSQKNKLSPLGVFFVSSSSFVCVCVREHMRMYRSENNLGDSLLSYHGVLGINSFSGSGSTQGHPMSDLTGSLKLLLSTFSQQQERKLKHRRASQAAAHMKTSHLGSQPCTGWRAARCPWHPGYIREKDELGVASKT